MFYEVQGNFFFQFFQVKELANTAKNHPKNIQDDIEKSDLFEIFSK
jgi:hypothetical protein